MRLNFRELHLPTCPKCGYTYDDDVVFHCAVFDLSEGAEKELKCQFCGCEFLVTTYYKLFFSVIDSEGCEVLSIDTKDLPNYGKRGAEIVK